MKANLWIPLLTFLLPAAHSLSAPVAAPASPVRSRTIPIATPPAPVWKWEPDVAGAGAGNAVSSAGDVNGDGFTDLLVGARKFANEEADEGRVLVFYGSPEGLSDLPDWTFEINQAAAQLGSAVSAAGDINGDGYDDILVGAPFFSSNEDTQNDEGAVLLFLGGADGLPAEPDWQLESNKKDTRLGGAIAGAGDVNGDGYDDLLIGASQWESDSTQSNEGVAWLYLGDGSGIPRGPAWQIESDLKISFLGCAVAGGGDVNGDGFADIAIGACLYDTPDLDEGLVEVYYGGEIVSPGEVLFPEPDWSMTPDPKNAEANFGAALAFAGDVDGNGYDDLLVGAYKYDDGQTDSGAAFLYLGSETGLEHTSPWRVTIDQKSGYWGSKVSSAGDFNGDGIDDILVSSYAYTNGQDKEGGVGFYPGSLEGPSTTASWILESNLGDAQLGIAIAYAGDVNGDGCGEIAVGASNYSNQQTGEGQVRVYAGDGRDTDHDGFCATTEHFGDCNDSDPAIFPGAAEQPGDGIDQDCDGVELCFVDADGDGHGTSSATAESADLTCGTAGLTPADRADDCDDSVASTWPGATETCNYTDDDCDGAKDEEVTTPFYQDSDGDSFGNPESVREDCSQPTGYVAENTDCNDLESTIYPGAFELVADGVDQNCDTKEKCYADADDDGYRPSAEATVESTEDLDCEDAGEATEAEPIGDCDDADATLNPAAAEQCDGVDNDCNNVIDNGTSVECPTGDFDGDQYTEQNGDCDDQSALIHPNAEERCDDLDNNCDSQVDEEDACAEPTPGGDGEGCGCRTEGGASAPPAGLLVLVAAVGMRLRRRR